MKVPNTLGSILPITKIAKAGENNPNAVNPKYFNIIIFLNEGAIPYKEFKLKNGIPVFNNSLKLTLKN